MTIFEYFLVLLSITLSLGLTHLATGMGELIRARRAVRWSLPHALWLVFCFAAIVDVWASTWLMRDQIELSIAAVFFMLSSALSLYLAAMWLIPRNPGEVPADLYAFMLAERRLFLGAFLFYMIAGVTWNIVLLPPGHFDLANYYIAIPVVAALSLAWWSDRRWVQLFAPILILALMALYFTVYFSRMG